MFKLLVLVSGTLWALPVGAQDDLDPLRNPNVAVHVLEKKPFRDEGRAEVVLYPVVPQLNGEFTQHVGTALSFVYHLQENFGLTLTPVYNWYARSSGFNRELNNSVSGEARPATSSLLDYGAHLGFEVAPLYGKFALYDGILGRFSVVVHAGAGLAHTRHELKEGNAFGPATYGDTGIRLLMAVGAGFRVQLGQRFTLRLEVNDLAYAARVDRVNGCSEGDLSTLVHQQGQGGALSASAVSGSCKVSSFQGTDKNGYTRVSDLQTALDLTRDTASDVLNNLGLYAGFGFVF